MANSKVTAKKTSRGRKTLVDIRKLCELLYKYQELRSNRKS
jgi:hypothetical protein